MQLFGRKKKTEVVYLLFIEKAQRAIADVCLPERKAAAVIYSNGKLS